MYVWKSLFVWDVRLCLVCGTVQPDRRLVSSATHISLHVTSFSILITGQRTQSWQMSLHFLYSFVFGFTFMFFFFFQWHRFQDKDLIFIVILHYSLFGWGLRGWCSVPSIFSAILHISFMALGDGRWMGGVCYFPFSISFFALFICNIRRWTVCLSSSFIITRFSVSYTAWGGKGLIAHSCISRVGRRWVIDMQKACVVCFPFSSLFYILLSKHWLGDLIRLYTSWQCWVVMESEGELIWYVWWRYFGNFEGEWRLTRNGERRWGKPSCVGLPVSPPRHNAKIVMRLILETLETDHSCRKIQSSAAAVASLCPWRPCVWVHE